MLLFLFLLIEIKSDNNLIGHSVFSKGIHVFFSAYIHLLHLIWFLIWNQKSNNLEKVSKYRPFVLWSLKLDGQDIACNQSYVFVFFLIFAIVFRNLFVFICLLIVLIHSNEPLKSGHGLLLNLFNFFFFK